jgi:hypothetical protein
MRASANTSFPLPPTHHLLNQHHDTTLTSLHDINSSAPVEEESGGKEKKKKKSAKWSSTTTRDFIRVLTAVKATTGTKGTSFKSQAWTTIVSRVQGHGGPMASLERGQLQSKLNDLKKKFNLFTALKDASGFGWDASAGTVTAPEKVWTAYLAEHPKASVFRERGLENYDALYDLFGASIATGK